MPSMSAISSRFVSKICMYNRR